MHTEPLKEYQPPIPEDLVRWLEGVFPNTVPSMTDNDRQIGKKIGEAGVVSFLRHKLEEQLENPTD